MSTLVRSRSGNPPSGFPPLDPRLRRGTSPKAAAAPPLLIREKPPKPPTARPPESRRRPPIVTRAELAPCTCPEQCERDHTDG
jgi:hypothetical protein